MGLVWPFPTRNAAQYQRVDQGWDLKGPIGAVLAAAPGTIQYAHDPSGFGPTYPVLILDTPNVNGRGIYYGHVVPVVPAGTHVQAGQAIASTAFGPQGNATEWGWLEIGWWNNGPVGNGAAMQAALGGTQGQSNNQGGNTPGDVQFTYGQLEFLWNQAGGNPQAAPIAAAVAMAESTGHSGAQNFNTNGSVDRGLWQINSIHGAQSTFDIMGNARAAVAISNNGTNWSPWVTYQTGAYKKFLQSGVAPDSSAPINGTNAASGQASGTTAQLESCGAWEWVLIPGACIAGGGQGAPQLPGQSASGIGGTIDSLSPAGVASGIVKGIIQGLINPFIQLAAGVLGITGGIILVGAGIFLIVRETQTYQEASGLVHEGETAGMRIGSFAAGPEAAAAANTAGAGTSTRPARQPRPAPAPNTAELLRAEAARYRGYAQATDAYRKARTARVA